MNRLIAILSLPCALSAQALLPSSQGPAPRTITVSGEAEVKVAPDEVVLTLGIETLRKELAETRRVNDQHVKGVIAAATACGVAPKDIQTDYLNLQPEYENTSSRKNLLGYLQRTTLLITLREVSKFEALLTSVLQAGAEYVHGVEFRTTELRKHRDAARTLAVKAAKEKAEALAAPLGQRIGKPMSIHEGQAGWWSSYGSWWGRSWGMGMSQNVTMNAGGAPSTMEGPLAPGTLSIRAQVTAAFELE